MTLANMRANGVRSRELDRPAVELNGMLRSGEIVRQRRSVLTKMYCPAQRSVNDGRYMLKEEQSALIRRRPP